MLSKDLLISHEIQAEDISICESVQKGIKSNGYFQGRISPLQEKALWHFQNLIRKTIQKSDVAT